MSTLSDAAAILRHPDSRYTLLRSILTASTCPSSQEAHLQAAGATLLVCRKSQKWLGAYIPPVPQKPLASESCGGINTLAAFPRLAPKGRCHRHASGASQLEQSSRPTEWSPPCLMSPLSRPYFPAVSLLHSPTDFPWECVLRKIFTHQTSSKGLIQGN